MQYGASVKRGDSVLPHHIQCKASAIVPAEEQDRDSNCDCERDCVSACECDHYPVRMATVMQPHFSKMAVMLCSLDRMGV